MRRRRTTFRSRRATPSRSSWRWERSGRHRCVSGVAALFERFPGFPEGANLVVDLHRYEEATGLRHIDFFLAAVTDHTHAGLARAVATLMPVRHEPPIRIDSTETALTRTRRA